MPRLPRLSFALVLFLIALLAGCMPGNSAATPDSQATIQAAVATQLAQTNATPTMQYEATIAAQGTQISILQATAGAPPAPTSTPAPPPPAPTPDDTTALRNALAAYLAWPPSQVEFTIGVMDNGKAKGGIRRAGEQYGAMWAAAKVEGVWEIAHVGQGVPPCDRVNALGIPVDWFDYCVNESGDTVQR